MQFDLGRRADYAIRCVLSLARAPQGLRKAREIAEEMDVPRSWVPGILGTLVQAGVAESVPGRGGGYRLGPASADVSLLDVIEAVDGPLASTNCVLRGGACQWDGRCAVHEAWAGAQEAMRSQLAAVTIAEIARIDRELPGGMHGDGQPDP